MRVYATLSAGILSLLAFLVVVQQQQVQHVVSHVPVVDLKYYNKELLGCLYQNIYHEARNQPRAGQLAVMYVTLNRVTDHRYPNTICEVVMQGPHQPSWKSIKKLVPVKHQCQFSWYCDGKSDTLINSASFGAIKMLVGDVLLGKTQMIDITDGATHYHATYVSPSWARTITKTVAIEDHIFYRWEN